RPPLVLADEPTAGLDPDTTASILALLKDLREELHLAIIIITHEMDVVRAAATDVARLDRGVIVEQGGLTDLLHDPESELGRQLLRPSEFLDYDGPGELWSVAYVAPNVSPNWLVSASRSLAGGGDVGILSASIETVGAVPVGRATLILDGVDGQAFRERLQHEGIHAERIDTAPIRKDVA
ncbi:MAG: methionine ABC transporter ATP-binding protein, partial [Gordonia sp. (in: high G+C Gram-positive bacteria)]